MFRKIISLIVLQFTVINGANAHDAWIVPTPIGRDGGGAFDVSFAIGHGGEARVWPALPDHVLAFYSISAEGRESHLSAIDIQQARSSKRIETGSSDIQIIALDTFRHDNVLEADKFNAYVKEEGIKPIEEFRFVQGLTNIDGREKYSRHFKAIATAHTEYDGERNGDYDTTFILRPIGQLLEIVPERNPLNKNTCDTLPLRVFYRGRPLPEATIHINALENDTAPSKIKTNAEGRAFVETRPEGRWYAHVAWADVVNAIEPDGAYMTAFASLSIDSNDVLDRAIGAPCLSKESKL